MNRTTKPKGRSKYGLPMLLVILGVGVAAALGIITSYSNASAETELEGLPNYTDVKEKIVVDGLKYEKQPKLGPDDAPVKVIEFADFKCPACKQWKQTYFKQFVQDYVDTGKVQLYFMNYAFLDRDSYLAASAGEAILRQNNEKFWEFMDKLYDNQGDESRIWATEQFLLTFVKENISGIDYDRFKQDLQAHTYLYDVKEDYKIAGSYGVNGTPKFMVNGVLLPTMSYEELTEAIEQQLAAAK